MATPDYGEIVLGGTRFKLAGKPSVTAVDRFPGKVTIGDYSEDSNDLLSSWSMGDLTGGHGIADHIEGTTDNRFRYGNLNTRSPKQLAKPWKRYDETVSTAYVYPLGDMTIAGTTTRYAVAGVHRLYSDVPTGTTTAWTDRGAITGVPTDKSVAFTGTAAIAMLYVPQGTNGYSVYDTSGPTLRNVAGNTFVSFCLWDNKLIGIDTTGQLYYATQATAAADTTFTSYGATAKLDPAFTPKHLVVYYDRIGNPAIYVITDQNTWVFDPATPTLYLVPDMGSPNPNFGKAACVWRGLLYVSSGMDIYEYNGSVRRNVGLSRDNGLPALLQGQIVDLAPAQNGLYAYVRGQASGSDYYESMHEYSGYGWGTTFATGIVAGQIGLHAARGGPAGAAISRAGGNGNYFLWWGHAGYDAIAGYANAGFQPLPTADTNPAAAVTAGGFSFGYTDRSGLQQEQYYLDTGRFDAGMPGYAKIASGITIALESYPTSDAADNALTLKYYLDGDTAGATPTQDWSAVYAGTSKRVTIPFGTADSDGITPGVLFREIEFRLLTGTSYSASTPVVRSMVLAFRKVMNPSLSWTFPVDLSAPYHDLSPEQLRARLTTLRTQGTFVAMKHQAATYRVAVAGYNEQQEAGKDLRGMAMVSVLEIPEEVGLAAA